MNTTNKRSVRLATAALVPLALLVTTTPARAQRADDRSPFRYVMLVPSVNGEQRMEIYGFSHQILSPRDTASGNPTGKRIHRPFTVTKLAGAGVDLLGLMLDGKTLDSVVVRVLQGDGVAPPTYIELRLYAVKVTSYSVNGSGLDDGSIPAPGGSIPIPTETYELVYDKIMWTNSDGTERADTWNGLE